MNFATSPESAATSNAIIAGGRGATILSYAARSASPCPAHPLMTRPAGGSNGAGCAYDVAAIASSARHATAMRMLCRQHPARLHDDLAIALVARAMLRLFDLHPAHLVHLVVVGVEAAAARLHQEVVDVLEDAHQRFARRIAP